MSENNFLERWSRLKREAAEQRDKTRRPDEPATERAAENESIPGAASAPEADQPPFDPASLPPIESISAASDIRAYLAHGVPAALTHAALRRAWIADPAIRDFVGLSENAWDFNDPSSIPGFGGIGGSENLRRLVAHFTDGSSPEADDRAAAGREESESSRSMPDSVETPVEGSEAEEVSQNKRTVCDADEPELLQDGKEDAAPRNGEGAGEYSAASPRRGHGRALPE